MLSVTPEVCIPSYSNCVRLHIEHDYPIFCARLIKKSQSIELSHYYVYTTFGMHPLCSVCVICNSKICHSFHNDCSHIEDADSGQSLVLVF